MADEQKWHGGVLQHRLVTRMVIVGNTGEEDQVQIISDEPYEEPKPQMATRVHLWLTVSGFCVVMAALLSVIGHSLLLDQWRVESQMREDRIIAEIKREDFSTWTFDWSQEERLAYIAILSKEGSPPQPFLVDESTPLPLPIEVE